MHTQLPVISRQQLIDGLHKIHATQQAFVEIEVDCSANDISKKCPYHDDVKKISTISGRLAAKTDKEGTYENAVNRQLEREGQDANFVALPSNYIWIDGPFAQYKSTGKLGLPLKVTAGSSKWIRASTGEELTPEELEQWRINKKDGVNRQGTEKPVTWRVPLVENIQSITAAGTTLAVE